MDESQTQIDMHNAQVLREEITMRLDSIVHEANCIYGLLDDLAIYLPDAEQTS